MKNLKHIKNFLLVFLIVLLSSGIFSCQKSKIFVDSVENLNKNTLENTTTVLSENIEEKKIFEESKIVERSYLRYYNHEADFYLEYPADTVVFTTNPYEKIPADKLLLYVKTEKIDDADSKKTLGYDSETAIKDEKELAEGDFGEEIDMPFEPSKKVIKIGNIFAKEFIVFSRFDVCDVVFERILIFYNKGYRITIGVCAEKDGIIKQNPTFFTYDTENCSENLLVWKRNSKESYGQNMFYENLLSKSLKNDASMWYGAFDEIKERIILQPTLDINAIEGLSFRSVYQNEKDKLKNILRISSYPEFFNFIEPGPLKSLNKFIAEKAENNFHEFEDVVKSAGTTLADSFSGNIYISDFCVSKVNENIASIYLTTYCFSGGVYGNTSISTINYDLKNNKEIKTADLFKPEFDYTDFLSKYCLDNLKLQINNNQEEIDEELLAEGAGSAEENFNKFIISDKCLIIKFSEYQIGPYSAGMHDVYIPFEIIEKNINKDILKIID